MTAAWCNCAAGRLSLVCPSCKRCFCSALEATRNSFWMTAPVELINRRSEEHKRRLEQRSSSVAPASSATVLVVDDDEEMRMVVVDVVEQMGYRTITAAHAEEALSILKEYRPEVVITDALMPRMDGRELCRRIKTEDSSIKVIVVTSLYTGVRYRLEAMKQFRADEFLPKPLDLARLGEVLAKLAPIAKEPTAAEVAASAIQPLFEMAACS
jgi:CheY-like chemotaxis protein